MAPTMTVDVHVAPDARRTALEADVRSGLLAEQKTLPPIWFYDERGSLLFDEITRLPEYYPTRTERSTGTPAPSSNSAGPTPWSSWDRGRPRRRGCCSTRWRPAGGCGASSRST